MLGPPMSNTRQLLLQHAQSMLREAKIEGGPDEQFEINWHHRHSEGSVRD
jgi:hypothetical protein